MRHHKLLHYGLRQSWLVALVMACTDPNELPPAEHKNVVDTLALYALSGTPVQTPSGYSLHDRFGGQSVAVRTDLTTEFEFVFEMMIHNNDTTRYFIPQAALGLRVNNALDPGLQRRAEAFGAVVSAPANGYITRDSILVDSGQVFVVRSRLVCGIGVPLYAKLEILRFIPSTRSVELQVLANTNCGYRGLRPGLPAR